MINKEKIASQVLFPRLNIDDYLSNDEYKLLIHQLVNRGVGGFCIFGGNWDSVEHTVNYLQALAAIPLLFCADFEYGTAMRMTEGNEFPHSMAIANSGASENAFKIGQAIAKEAKSLGIHWNLAPVVDINSNKLNPVINIRSFGENSDIVCEFSEQFIIGTQSEKVLACAKHFPGHGDTKSDSHLELPTLNKSLLELQNMEIIPFKNSINNDVKSIMIGHLNVPALDSDNIPSSLSENVINYLRNNLKYPGIIITDALEMKSITKFYSSGEAAVKAVNAGNNIVLMPEDNIEAINALINNSANDDFYSKLKSSYDLIIKAKRWCGVMPQFAKLEQKTKIFIQHQKTALSIAYKALKINGNKELLLINDKINFAGFAYLQKAEDMRAASRFFTMLAQATENDCDFAFFDSKIDESNIEAFNEGTEDAELIIFPVFVRSYAYHGQIDDGKKVNEIIKKIARDKKYIVIIFGSPYVAENIEADLLINTYSDSFPSIAASIVLLTGRENALDY